MTMTRVTCYRQINNLIEPQNEWTVCPKYYKGLCCFPGDECLDEQTCHNAKGSSLNGSGYYIGLCTDATYKSPSCSSRCTHDKEGDVTYNSTTNLWACCGTQNACNNPTNETFLAPPPQQLLAAASSQSATTATSTSIPNATVTVTSTLSAMVDQTSSLNEGAKAGIGVGAALAAVAIIALLVWVILLRKKLRSHGQARYSAGRRDGSTINEGLPNGAQRDAVHEHELSGYGRPHEMEGR